MASQFSHLEGGLNIYFVVSAKYDSPEQCSDDMWEAFNKCQESELEPKWIEEKECYNCNPTKTDIFVIQAFEGKLFEQLQKFKCLIIGPLCLLRCFLTGEAVPSGTSPVFTTAMRDIVICASGFCQKTKEDIRQKVEYMGGIYIKELRGCITHLVTDSVLSKKYEKAVESGIAIYTDQWVFNVWEMNLANYIKATEPIFDRFKCPIFLNLIVTTTNLGKRQKEDVRKYVTEHGGTYMGDLDGSKVKLVIAKEYVSSSAKLKFAFQNNIPCVRIEWLFKCIEAGYTLPIAEYIITPSSKVKCSTPEHGSMHQISLNCSTVSTIPFENHANFVEETMSSTISAHSESRRHNYSQNVLAMDKLDLKEAKKAGPFLDGCNIYLAGFAPQQRDKIIKILNVGSATRFDDVSDALTHVLVGDPAKAHSDLKLINSKSLNPHILTVNWLEDSIKLKKLAPEEAYILDKNENFNTKASEPASPLSKKSLQLLKSKRPPVPKFDIDKPPVVDHINYDEPDIVQQYINKTSDRTAIEIGNSSSTEKNTTAVYNQRASLNDVPENVSSIPLSQTSSVTEHIFKQLTFFVTGFNEEDNSIVVTSISGLGGRLVSKSFSGIPDFGVVPITGTKLKHTVNEVVTNLFIDHCIDSDKLVDIEYYHRPILVPEAVKPLKDCVIATSGYTGAERIYLTHLAVSLGAMHQDSFAKRTNIEKGQYAGTHLICTSPIGNKYNAAVRWKLPAVTGEWLRACLEKLRLVNETPYLIGETMAPERPSNEESQSPAMGPPKSTPSRQIFTPKRHLTHTPGIETPLINKRLNLSQHQNITNSPFHVTTPNTPYGQIFKPNPSPDTRKAWAKWIDDIPEKVEPPAKQRRVSTPLSELKRQVWSAMRKPLDTSQQNESTSQDHNVLLVREKYQEIENHEDKTLNEDDAPLAPKKLSFAEEPSPARKNQINEQLEEMNKMFRATTSNSESRFSLHGDNVKVYEEATDNINHYMPATQPESVGWEDPQPHGSLKSFVGHETIPENMTLRLNQEEEEEKEDKERRGNRNKIRKFMLSGLKDRAGYESIIKKLGGEVSTEGNFDITATHLLCLRLVRNEKMLGGIASGKWILHCSYIKECEKMGKFIDEDEFEWGNPQNKCVTDFDNEQEKQMALAAHRWRIKLTGRSYGAFHNMVAMLMVPSEKYAPFERLIRAGGGIVVEAKPPYNSPNGKKVTHCFIHMNKLEQPVDWAMLANKGILCYVPTYLNQFLIMEPSDPRDHVIAEFKKYFPLLPKELLK